MDNLTLSNDMIQEFTNFETIRHLVAKPPKDAYFYIPQGTELIEFDEKNVTKTLRRIFEGGVEYNNYEKGKLNELKKEIEKQNEHLKNKKNKKSSKTMLILPDYWRDYHSLRFLQATGYNLSKTIDMITNHLEWRKINLPPRITENAMKILNSGFIYIHGRDSKFRPIMVIVANIYDKYKKTFSFSDWEIAVIYFMEYAINNLLLPGQIENWNIICDLNGISITSIPEDLRKILSILQNNYRCRLYVMFIVNIGGFVSFAWGLIKKFMDPSTQRKIRLLKGDALKDLFQFINRKQIEKKFGGLAEDVKEFFFPPIFPSNEYLMENESKEKILVNEEEYKKIIDEKREIVPSPFLQNSDNKGIIEEEISSNSDEIEFIKDNENNVNHEINANIDFEKKLSRKQSNTLDDMTNSESTNFNKDLLEEVEAERNKIVSANRITGKTLKQNEKHLSMSILEKNIEQSPNYINKDDSSVFISICDKKIKISKKQSRPSNVNGSKSLNTTTNNMSDYPTKYITSNVNNDLTLLYNESKGINLENCELDNSKLKVEDFYIKEEKEIQKVCCSNPSSDSCQIF